MRKIDKTDGSLVGKYKLKSFWHLVDSVLPRSIVRVPYSFVASIIKFQISRIPNSKVWFRNSFIKGNLVFGVSDLDISVMVDSFNRDQLTKIDNELKKIKQFFPFVGEVNFLIRDHIEGLSASLNLYEKKRDPALDSLLDDTAPVGDDIEKAVFLLRMLDADKKNLLEIPFLRQKKWRSHFHDLNLDAPDFIDKEVIIKKIINLIDPHSKIEGLNEAISFLFSPLGPEENIFTVAKPTLWKFIYPHKYFWADNLESENLEQVANSSLKWVCLRQIDWEIWGLNTQLATGEHSRDNIQRHVNRLHRVASALSQDDFFNARVEKLFHNLSQIMN